MYAAKGNCPQDDTTKVVKVERNTKKVSFLSLQYFIQRQAHRKGKMFTTQSNYYI